MRRFARGWLLWLALLVPIAQAFAGVHALSHVGERQDDGLTEAVHCDLCLTAADLGAGAPQAEPVSLADSRAMNAVPGVACGGVLRAVDLVLPPVRAPPTFA